jgi:hypothetical protein
MSMRRFTRLTNAFGKKPTNHAHMVELCALWYNRRKSVAHTSGTNQGQCDPEVFS